MTDYEKLIQAHNGDMALYYIWVKSTHSDDISMAAKDLCMTKDQILKAAELLKTYGFNMSEFISDHNRETVNPLPSDDPHEYTSQEISSAAKDPVFDAVIKEFTVITGKTPSKDDLSKLLNIYHNLGLGADSIFVIMHYCEGEKAPHKPTAKYIETVSYMLTNKGITDCEQIENWVDHIHSLKGPKNEIKAMLGITSRLTPSLDAYIEKWADGGYSMSVIESAYEKTLKNTGKLSWEYMNKVLENMPQDTEANECTDSLPQTVIRKK